MLPRNERPNRTRARDLAFSSCASRVWIFFVLSHPMPSRVSSAESRELSSRRRVASSARATLLHVLCALRTMGFFFMSFSFISSSSRVPGAEVIEAFVCPPPQSLKVGVCFLQCVRDMVFPAETLLIEIGHVVLRRQRVALYDSRLLGPFLSPPALICVLFFSGARPLRFHIPNPPAVSCGLLHGGLDL